jgi:hypothetical protein
MMQAYIEWAGDTEGNVSEVSNARGFASIGSMQKLIENLKDQEGGKLRGGLFDTQMLDTAMDKAKHLHREC